MQQKFTGMRYGDLKKQVAETVIEKLESLQRRYREIIADSGYVEGVLRRSAERVTPIADDTVQTVKRRMGLFTEAAITS